MKPLVPRALILVALSLLTLAIPLGGSWQSAFQPDLARNESLAGMMPSAGITKLAPLTAELPLDTSGSAFPTRTLGFVVGTFARKNHCQLTLELSHELISAPVACESMKDNAIAAFEFSKPIPDGLYQAVFHSTADADSDAVAIYLYERPAHQRVVTALRLVEGRWTLGAFSQWVQTAPRRAWLFALGVMVLLVGGWLAYIPRFIAVVMLFALHAVIAPYFSGHDETAHIEMLHAAMRQDSPEELKAFHIAANQLVHQSQFFRANSVMARDLDDCPHRILFACGESEKPLWLYRHYAPLLRSVFVDGQAPPRRLLWAMRGLNLFILVGFLSLIFLVGGAQQLNAQATALVFCGALLGQMASITNDIPMYFIGLWLTAALAMAAIGPSQRRAFFALLLATAWLMVGKNIDIGWVAGLPVLALGWFCFALRRLHLRESLLSRPLAWRPLVAYLILAAAGHYLLRLIAIPLAARLPEGLDFAKSMLGLVSAAGTRVAMIRTVHNAFSYFGSFVWGHSIFGLPLYLLLLAIAAFAASKGARYLHRQHPCAGGVMVVAALVLGAYALMVDSVAAHFNFPGVTQNAAIKLRFLAAGLGGLVMLPYFGLSARYERASWRSPIGSTEVIWMMVLLLHFLPRFYLADYQ